MFESLIDQIGWPTIIGAVIVLVLVAGFIRKFVLPIVALVFTLLGIMRLWTLLNL